jgi:hypothetical protein
MVQMASRYLMQHPTSQEAIMDANLTTASEIRVTNVKPDSAVAIEFLEDISATCREKKKFLTALLKENNFTVESGEPRDSVYVHTLRVSRPIRGEIIALFKSRPEEIDLSEEIEP